MHFPCLRSNHYTWLFYVELSPVAHPGPCYIDNGGCLYLCLAISKTRRRCACPDNLEDCDEEGTYHYTVLYAYILMLKLGWGTTRKIYDKEGGGPY